MSKSVCVILHVDVVSVGDVRDTFRREEHFVKTMIIDVNYNQLQHTPGAMIHH